MSWLSFDIGGTFIKYGVFSAGELIEKGKIATPYSEEGFFDTVAKITVSCDQKKPLRGIGLSFPGFIDGKRGVAVMAGALTPLHGINIKEALAAKLHRPLPIAIANDANCAALAEFYQGNGQGAADLLLVTLGTGIGCGIILNGEIREGHSFKAGESGMMITDLSHSGFTTAHDLASTRALVTGYGELYGLATELVTGEMIFEDERAATKQLRQDWGQRVAAVLFNIVVTLDPEKILIGGGVSQNPKLLPLVEEALAAIPYWQEFHVPVATCYFHNDAGLVGAYHLIKELEESK
ncbi:ROK family protein [Candidatus Enterococcus leclercqii]|uniref:ROK family protein n=1 Tax=Candidatus Enterococcus leclercqii TaxID=1857218 RepID=UPI00137A6FEA|nr:ROK family protein [Enterococcus sp. CU9D]KAF1290775.1 hypothetical protein BAU14_08340 [Enterococcus sp. CU9D]